MNTYLDFITARAAGELMTPAAWMRSYIRSHAEYEHDSRLSPRIAADLLATCHRIGLGLERVPELHGDFHISAVRAKDAFDARLVSDAPSGARAERCMEAVTNRYAQRAELIARRREMRAKLDEQLEQAARTRAELEQVEDELGAFFRPNGVGPSGERGCLSP